MLRPGSSCAPGEFVDILQKYIHPQWWSIGVESNRWGNRVRAGMGISDRMGSIWVSKPGVYYSVRNGMWLEDGDMKKEWLLVMPANEIPPNSIKNAEWDEGMARWKSGKLLRGWQGALEELVGGGYLRESPILDKLAGKRLEAHKEWKIL